MLIRITLFCLACCWPLAASALPPDVEADRLAIKAKTALEAKDFAQAVASFEQMEKLNVPQPQSFHYLKGVALNGIGKHGAAKRALANYLEITGTSGKYYKEALMAYSVAESGTTFEPEVIDVPGQGYAIGKYEVTQVQWRKVMGKDPDRLNHPGCDDCPVEHISWNHAQAYLEKLTALTGIRFRLPTASEWQYACQGGVTAGAYCGGDDISELGWYWNNSPSPKKTHPIGGKRPNGYGLFDMTGNVAEWTEDCWNGDCAKRTVRGGAFCSFQDGALTDFKYGETLDYHDECTGLRVAHDLN